MAVCGYLERASLVEGDRDLARKVAETCQRQWFRVPSGKSDPEAGRQTEEDRVKARAWSDGGGWRDASREAGRVVNTRGRNLSMSLD